MQPTIAYYPLRIFFVLNLLTACSMQHSPLHMINEDYNPATGSSTTEPMCIDQEELPLLSLLYQGIITGEDSNPQAINEEDQESDRLVNLDKICSNEIAQLQRQGGNEAIQQPNPSCSRCGHTAFIKHGFEARTNIPKIQCKNCKHVQQLTTRIAPKRDVKAAIEASPFYQEKLKNAICNQCQHTAFTMSGFDKRTDIPRIKCKNCKHIQQLTTRRAHKGVQALIEASPFYQERLKNAICNQCQHTAFTTAGFAKGANIPKIQCKNCRHRQQLYTRRAPKKDVQAAIEAPPCYQEKLKKACNQCGHTEFIYGFDTRTNIPEIQCKNCKHVQQLTTRIAPKKDVQAAIEASPFYQEKLKNATCRKCGETAFTTSGFDTRTNIPKIKCKNCKHVQQLCSAQEERERIAIEFYSKSMLLF